MLGIVVVRPDLRQQSVRRLTTLARVQCLIDSDCLITAYLYLCLSVAVRQCTASIASAIALRTQVGRD